MTHYQLVASHYRPNSFGSTCSMSESAQCQHLQIQDPDLTPWALVVSLLRMSLGMHVEEEDVKSLA